MRDATELATMGNIKEASEKKDNLYKDMKKVYEESKDEYLESLMRDIQSDNDNEGQVGIALESDEFWKKWGKHYFPALRIAHNIEMCTNFKDPGLQGYASDLFR